MAHHDKIKECGWLHTSTDYIVNQPGYKYTDLVLRPVWMFICTVGNITNILLLRRFRTYQATFLLATAMFDLIFMWSWFPLYFRDTVTGSKNIDEGSPKTFFIACEFVGNVAAQGSDWVLVAFSFSRLLTIIFPFKCGTWFNQCRMRILATCMIPFAIVLNLRLLIAFAYRNDKLATETWLRDWLRLQQFCDIAVPFSTFIILLVINAVVVGILCRHQKLKLLEESKIITSGNGCAIRTHGSDEQIPMTIRLLVASVTMYLISRIPFVTWHIIAKLEDYCLAHLTDDQNVIFMPIYFQFLYANYSINFLLYCGTSRAYLKKAVKMITSCFRREAAKRNVDRTVSSETVVKNMSRAELLALETPVSVEPAAQAVPFRNGRNSTHRRSTGQFDTHTNSLRYSENIMTNRCHSNKLSPNGPDASIGSILSTIRILQHEPMYW